MLTDVTALNNNFGSTAHKFPGIQLFAPWLGLGIVVANSSLSIRFQTMFQLPLGNFRLVAVAADRQEVWQSGN